jgi:hypothetical protein
MAECASVGMISLCMVLSAHGCGAFHACPYVKTQTDKGSVLTASLTDTCLSSFPSLGKPFPVPRQTVPIFSDTRACGGFEMHAYRDRDLVVMFACPHTGGNFVFTEGLASSVIVALRVLPSIVFFSSVSSILVHTGKPYIYIYIYILYTQHITTHNRPLIILTWCLSFAHE